LTLPIAALADEGRCNVAQPKEVPMADEPATFALEDDGRLASPEALAAFLAAAEGRNVRIEAANVSILTSLHLQVHAAAVSRWTDAGLRYDLVNTSDQFNSCLSLLGWQPDAAASEEI